MTDSSQVVKDAQPFPLPARPTTYRGIKMRSRMEAEFAARLDDVWRDEFGDEWSYEPMCFASATGQYLPDFMVVTPGGQRIYIEVKPEVGDFDALRNRVEIIWESEPDAFLCIMELRQKERGWIAMPCDRKWRRL